MKFICAAYSKTGTKTLAKCLRKLGFRVDDLFEHFDKKDLWLRVFCADPKDPLAQKPEIFREIFKDVDACTDSPSYLFWEEILQVFPDAKVILIERDEDKWVDSLDRHFEVERKENLGGWMIQYLPRQLVQLLNYDVWIGQWMHRDLNWSGAIGPCAPFGPNRCNLMFARKRYREHNAYVKMKCPPEKLLVYNFKDGWEPLCKFTGVDNIPIGSIPRENVGAQIVTDVIEKHPLVVEQQRVFTRNLIIFVVLFGAFIGYTVFLYVEKIASWFGE